MSLLNGECPETLARHGTQRTDTRLAGERNSDLEERIVKPFCLSWKETQQCHLQRQLGGVKCLGLLDLLSDSIERQWWLRDI